MLKQPRSQDICCNFWEDATFLLVLFAVGVIIFFACTLSTTYTSITGITCKIEHRKEEKKYYSINCSHVKIKQSIYDPIKSRKLCMRNDNGENDLVSVH